MVYVLDLISLQALPVYLLDLPQLRVTSAVPGRVKFELDIQKEHTVLPSLKFCSHSNL
jgi:hypothetical protein